MSGETWSCGDCGAVYPYSVDYCTRRGLDHANLVIGGRLQRWAYPVYLATADALNIRPPRANGKPWPTEAAP